MPNLYVIADGNGSGKTTIAKSLLPNYFNCNEFVNADIMAAEMSPDNVTRVAITAGKRTLELINKLFDDRMSFAIETTLSGNVHKKIIQKAQQVNDYVVLIYVWVKSPRVSVSRVRSRKRLGGHFVPKEDVIRRYKRRLINESMDKLILERMAINEPLVIERHGKIKKVSPFILAHERWGKDFVKQWRLANKKG